MENNVTVSGTTTLKVGRFRRIHRILRTGNNIHLKPGFTAPSGINFTAEIGTVTNVAKRFYYLKDHLGSIRVVARLYLWYKYRRGLGPTKSGRINEAGDIVSSDDYDPWGMQLNGRSTNISYSNEKYKFAGKERDVETGWDYLGARFYDSRIGIMRQVDPLSEKHPDYSPYTYVLNNPLILIDPDGRQEVSIQYRAFIPQESVGGFRGDNRTFSADPSASSRVTINVRVETDPAKNQGNPLLGSEVLVSPTQFNFTGGERTSTGPQMPMINVTQSTDGTVTVSVEMNLRNPYVEIGSGIRSDVNISVNQDATNAGIIGNVSGSPSFEANFSIEGGQNQNIPVQAAPTSTIGFIIGLQQTNRINTNVNLQQIENKEENRE